MALKEKIKLTNVELSSEVFKGNILIFKNIKSVKILCSNARKLLKKKFFVDDPLRIQERYNKEEFIKYCATAQNEFRKNKTINKLFIMSLEEIGLKIRTVFCDRYILRIQPCGISHSGGVASSVKYHRDTWGTNIKQQLNWWGPIYPIDRNRTICIFPEYWGKPIKNNSNTWSLGKYINESKKVKDGYAPTYKSYPTVLEKPSHKSEVRIEINPGDLMCFSSAHLHTSAINTTKLPRFSFETRTIDMDDIKFDRGAKNVDGKGRKKIFHLFTNLENGINLKNVIKN